MAINTWNQTGTTWGQNQWGQNATPTFEVTGIALTASVGDTEEFNNEGWGRLTWGTYDWGTFTLTTTIEIGGLGLTSTSGSVVVEDDIKLVGEERHGVI